MRNPPSKLETACREREGAPVVLLVEDELLVRMLGADILEDAGFEVVEAMNGEEAVTVLEARPDVQVLLTDVDMPGSIDGFELARHTSTHRPDIAILIVSGKVRPGPGEMPEGSLFVPKPYQPAALVQQIHQMLVG